MKGIITPGQRLPKGAYYDKHGKVVFPKNPPVPKLIVIRRKP